MRFPLKKIILIGMALILLYVAGNVAWFYLKYSPAEKSLKNELSQLSLPANYTVTSSTYLHGQCLDNCPLLRTVYKVNSTRETAGKAMRAALEAKGYTITDYLAGEVWATKDKVRVFTNSEPGLMQGTRDYAFNLEQQNQPISTLTINFAYQP